jgi:HK97 family phage major capsid protein
MSLAIKVGTAGYPLYIPGNSLTGAPNGTLLGIPVVFAEQALALGTAGDIYLADFGQYRIIEKAGIQAASSDGRDSQDRHSDTLRPELCLVLPLSKPG